jgi:hypothetical protein
MTDYVEIWLSKREGLPLCFMLLKNNKVSSIRRAAAVSYIPESTLHG